MLGRSGYVPGAHASAPVAIPLDPAVEHALDTQRGPLVAISAPTSAVGGLPTIVPVGDVVARWRVHLRARRRA